MLLTNLAPVALALLASSAAALSVDRRATTCNGHPEVCLDSAAEHDTEPSNLDRLVLTLLLAALHEELRECVLCRRA